MKFGGEVPTCPSVAHFQNPFPLLRCFQTTKRALTCNISKQVSVSASTFPLPYHMCSEGNNTVLCCSFTAEGTFLGPAACVIMLAAEKPQREGSESPCVRRVLKVDSREHSFGVPDESPAGCGLHAVLLLPPSSCSLSMIFLPDGGT